MKLVNQDKLSWEEGKSPKGDFHRFQRNISLALGGIKDTGPAGGGHPFDLALVRIPPGAAAWPRHAHSSQWEMLIILSGRGLASSDTESAEVGPGDCLLHTPETAHQITNTGSENLLYYVIADNPPVDLIRYPNSGKWFVKPLRKVFRMQETDYWDGEE